MHYGHPDVFDRVFHITRGGISKASRVINISEDIYSGIGGCFIHESGFGFWTFCISNLINIQDSTQPYVKGMLHIMNIFRQGLFLYDASVANCGSNKEVYRLVREGMSGSIRLLYLRGRLLVVMVNKFLVVIYIDSGNFLIFSG